MTPKEFFYYVESLGPEPLYDGRYAPVCKHLVRCVRNDAVVYSFIYVDTETNVVVYDLKNPVIEVPHYRDYSVRSHFLRHGYTIFTLTN